MLRMLRRKKSDPRKGLRAVLGEVELPTFPAVVTTALERVRDEDVSFDEMADLMSSDPGLSVRLLGTVNSAAFAMRHRVRNIHHAVSLLGRNQLESVLISLAVRDALPRDAGRGFDSQRFWVASARRATTGRALAEMIDPANRSESFTGSLLQDLAIPLLSRHRGDEYGDLLEAWHSGNEDLAGLERESFGWDHAEVAGWMCTEWEFPEMLTAAIRTHHGGEVEDGGDAPLPAVRRVAVLREVHEEHGRERFVEEVGRLYAIPADRAVEILDAGFEAADEIARLFV